VVDRCVTSNAALPQRSGAKRVWPEATSCHDSGQCQQHDGDCDIGQLVAPGVHDRRAQHHEYQSDGGQRDKHRRDMQERGQDQSDRAEDLGHADQLDLRGDPVCRPAAGSGRDEFGFGLSQLQDPGPGECDGEHSRNDSPCQIHSDLYSAISVPVFSCPAI